MSDERPEDIPGYKRWLKKHFEVEITEQTKVYYDTVAIKVMNLFEESNFWVEVTSNLRELDDEYGRQSGGYPLFVSDEEPTLLTKPFDSFLHKTLRKNSLENKSWPREPEGGWILPEDWYSTINDIVRTLFVVKYLDGVEFLTDRIRKLCVDHGLEFDAMLEAREEGYYAAHLHARREFEVPGLLWDTELKEVSVEMQITTQVQDLIRRLLHTYYEQSRMAVKREEIQWQWAYGSDEFRANYLGHVLHYMEGMIMEIRERQRG